MSGFSGKNNPVPLPSSAFGELSVSQFTGKIFAKFAYNINSELFIDNSTASGSLSVANSLCNISSGAAINSSGRITSKPVLEYRAGAGGTCRVTAIYDTPAAGNIQLVGLGTAQEGFYIGYNGTTFSIDRRRAGVDNFTPQSSFSEDKLDGTGASGMTIDTTMGNVFQIQYQWLGFGEIRFFVENPGTGKLFIFHRIQYSNAFTDTSTQNPNFPFQAESTNTTNATDVILRVASAGVFLEGLDSSAMFLVHGATASVATVTTEVAILSIRNNATYVGITNLILIQPKIITASADGSKPAIMNCYKNTTLGGTPSFTDFDSNTSPVSIDTAGTTVTGGIFLTSFSVGKSDNNILYLTDVPILLAPGDIFTVTGTSGANTDISASITWEERFG